MLLYVTTKEKQNVHNTENGINKIFTKKMFANGKVVYVAITYQCQKARICIANGALGVPKMIKSGSKTQKKNILAHALSKL